MPIAEPKAEFHNRVLSLSHHSRLIMRSIVRI